MVKFALFEAANDPESRPLNGSPVDGCFAMAGLGLELACVELGVMGRELGAELPAEDNIENTSCCGFLGCVVGTEPSFCTVGLAGADEFHKSANESAIR